MADLFSQFFGPDELVDFAVPEPRQVPAPPAVMMDPMGHLAYQSHQKDLNVDSAPYKASAFMRELSGVHTLHNDNTMAGAVPSTSTPMSQSYHQIVPSMPPGGALAPSQRFHSSHQYPGGPQAANVGAQFTGQAASSTAHLSTAVSGHAAYAPANAAAHYNTSGPTTAHFTPAAQLSHTGAAYAAPAPAPSRPVAAPAPPQPPALPMNPAPPPVAAPAPTSSFAAPTQIVGADGQVLTPTQMGELELARQRAARAAAGRRQQLIAQKRQREANKAAAAASQTAAQQQQAQQEGSSRSAKTQASAPTDNGRKPRRAAAGVTALTSTLSAALGSEEGNASEDDGDTGTGDGEAEQAGGTGDPVKDARKLKRLLRNRVSAQQARERKKQYVNTLEDQVKGLQGRVSELEQSLASTEAQNDALRRIIRNMQSGIPISPADAQANQLASAQRAGAGAGTGGLRNGSAAGVGGMTAMAGSNPPTPVSSGGAAAGMMHSGAMALAKPDSPHAIGNSAQVGYAAGGMNHAHGSIPVPPAPGQAMPTLPAEGSGTSSHPGTHGTAAAARMEDAQRGALVHEQVSKSRRLARQPTQSSLDVRAAAMSMMCDHTGHAMVMGGSSRPSRVDSLSLALDVEGVLGMELGGAGGEEEQDCLVVPQAPPMTVMQHLGSDQAVGMSGQRNSPASLHSGAGSLNLQQSF